MKGIEFARRGDSFLISTFEVIACGKDGEPEPIHHPWKKCCFSGDGEYVCAGSARQHALYVWEKSIGNLVRILHGTKGELLLDVVWHPVRPIISSISSGLVSIWAHNQVENWSACAPDFKELDENVEYDERESEFDIEDEDKSVDLSAENNLISVRQSDFEVFQALLPPHPIAAFCSSDEEYEDKNCLQFLPMAPEVEDPEDGWNSQDNSNGQESAASKDSVPADEDNLPGPSAAKRKKTQCFDIALEGTPSDGELPNLIETNEIYYLNTLFLSFAEPHPALQLRNKDKQMATGKKAAGRPRK